MPPVVLSAVVVVGNCAAETRRIESGNVLHAPALLQRVLKSREPMVMYNGLDKDDTPLTEFCRSTTADAPPLTQFDPSPTVYEPIFTPMWNTWCQCAALRGVLTWRPSCLYVPKPTKADLYLLHRLIEASVKYLGTRIKIIPAQKRHIKLNKPF